MAATPAHYLKQAENCARAADTAQLDNERAKHLRSQAACAERQGSSTPFALKENTDAG
jgi:predicted GNAT superfamily acetyltransferase